MFRPSSFFRNDPFFYDPFGLNNSFFEPVYGTSDTSMMNMNNNQQQQQQQQQIQQQSSSGDSDTRVGHTNKNRHMTHRHHGPLSIFSPLIAARSIPVPDMTVDMFTSPTAYTVQASCPGIDKKDINITIEDRILNIQAERKQEKRHMKPQMMTQDNNKGAGGNAPNMKRSPHMEESKTGPGSTTTEESKQMSTSPMNNKNKTNNNMMDEDDYSRYDYIESTYGHVQRSFTLPEDIDAGGLTAKYEDGVIKIHIPRLQQKQPNKQTITLQ